MSKIKIDCHLIEEYTEELKFVVIPSKHKGKWVFVRHQDRSTWEFPGGHIEEGELPDDAAVRELREESGAANFEIKPICNYSVDRDGKRNFGRVYFADIEVLGDCSVFEIDEVITMDKLPENLTYPIIIRSIIEKVRSMEKNDE